MQAFLTWTHLCNCDSIYRFLELVITGEPVAHCVAMPVRLLEKSFYKYKTSFLRDGPVV